MNLPGRIVDGASDLLHGRVTADGFWKSVYEVSPVGILGAFADGNPHAAGSRAVGTVVGLATGYATEVGAGALARGYVKVGDAIDAMAPDVSLNPFGEELSTGHPVDNVSGVLSGSRTKIPPLSDVATIRSLTRENQSADILVENGFNVEQNPNVSGVKKPDYRINGEIYDNYAPETSNARYIWTTVNEKVQAGQANSVVINLADSNAWIEALKAQFSNYTINGLNKIIIIDKFGNITIINGK